MMIPALDSLRPGSAGGSSVATGGIITTPGDGYTYHTFNSSGTFTMLSASKAVEYLVVGAGGGSNFISTTNWFNAGGGAGSIPATGSATLSAGSYSVTVGTSAADTNGGNSTFNGLTSTGGGKGFLVGRDSSLQLVGSMINGGKGGSNSLYTGGNWNSTQQVSGGGAGASGNGNSAYSVGKHDHFNGQAKAGLTIWGNEYGRGNAGARKLTGGSVQHGSGSFVPTANRGDGGRGDSAGQAGSAGVVVVRYLS